VLVITGMHHTFLAVDLQLIGTTGGTFLWPILALSNISQGSAALAMMFLAKKSQKLRGLSGTAALSAYLGITEPAMFGVNLRYRYPFISALIGSAIAGMILSIGKVNAFSVGVGGLPGFLSIKHEYWGTFFLGIGIVLVVPFILTVIFSKFSKEEI